MPAGTDTRNQSFRCHTLDRIFARCVNRCHHYCVGIVEAGRKVVEQIAKPGEPMRLRDREYAARAGFARRLEHRLDLHRVVPVIVEYLHAVPAAGQRKAPLDSAEARKPLGDFVSRNAEFMGDCHCRGGIRNIVPPRHRQFEMFHGRGFAALAVADRDVELRHAVGHADVGVAHVGLRVFAVSDDAPVLDAGDKRLNFRMVDAHHAEPVKRHILHELRKRPAYFIECAVMVEMFGVDIGDDGNFGRQFQEGAVALVGLHHHPVALAHARIGAIGVDDAAIDNGRVEPAGFEQRAYHRSRRRLAMRAANSDGLPEAHEFGQHLRAPYHRQQPLARRDKFWIVLADRGGNHQHLCTAEIFRLVADMAGNALVAQALHIRVFRLVGALHGVTQIVQHLRDAAHADAADADKMHDADGLRHLHSGSSFFRAATDLPPAIASTISASNRVASGLPASLAASARLFSSRGSLMAEPIRCASFSGSSVCCA